MTSFIMNCCSMHIGTYINIPRYNLLGLNSVTQMCVLGADCLVLDKQLVCSSLGKIISPRPPAFLIACSSCVGLSPQGLSPVQLSMSTVQFTFRQPSWWDLGCGFWQSQNKQSHNELPDPLTLTISPPSLLKSSSRLRCRSCLADVSAGTKFPTSVF